MAQKKKMSTKKFLAIWIPILVVLVGGMATITGVANYWSGVLDTYLGRGDKVITNLDSSSSWNSKYYNQKYTTSKGETGSQLAAAKVAEEISDEGSVLLKNNGALPLAVNSTVAPFGYRYYNPFFGGSGSGSVVATDDYVIDPSEALRSNFTVTDTFSVDDSTSVKKYYYDTAAGSDVLYYFDFTNSFNGSDQSIYEFDKSIYNTSSIAASTTGVVFLGRAGGENNDLWTIPYNKVGDIKASAAGKAEGAISKVTNAKDTTQVKHALDLMPEEEDALALAKENAIRS